MHTVMEHSISPCHIMECDVTECDTVEHSAPAPSPGLWLPKHRLIQAMRKIDLEMVHMIESLAPGYLVKR